MKNWSWILSALVLTAGAAHADTTYKTSTGAIFTQVNLPSGPAWKDPSGRTWSMSQGKFANNAIKTDTDKFVVDSPAVEACAKIGEKLPTLDDYQTLSSYFDWEGPQGKKDLFALFPDMKGHEFWTSSLAYKIKDVFFFKAFDSSPGNRNFKKSVQCLDEYHPPLQCDTTASSAAPDLNGHWQGQGLCSCANSGIPNSNHGAECGINLVISESNNQLNLSEGSVGANGFGIGTCPFTAAFSDNHLNPVNFGNSEGGCSIENKSWIDDSCYSADEIKLRLNAYDNPGVTPDQFQVFDFHLSDDQKTLKLQVSHGFYDSSCWISGELTRVQN